MDKFASTDTLAGMLQRGEYKRLVMENDDDLDFFDPKKTDKSFETVFENYEAYTSRPDNYDYFAQRQVKQKQGGLSTHENPVTETKGETG